MMLDNMTGITKGSCTVNDMFCRSQLITCNRVKECNGVCPFEDALKHADQTQTMNEQHIIDHDRDWIIGCIEHDGFIHTHRFDKANQIILEALSAETVQGWIPVSEGLPSAEYGEGDSVLCCTESGLMYILYWNGGNWCVPTGEPYQWINYETGWHDKVIAWMPLPEPYREDDEA